MSGGQLEYANFLGMWKEESKSPLINISFIHLSAQCSAWHNLNIFASCIINVSLKLAPRPPANYGLLRSHFILGARGVSLRSQFSHWKKDKGIRAKNAKPKTDLWNLPANFFWLLFFLMWSGILKKIMHQPYGLSEVPLQNMSIIWGKF